MTKRRRRCVRLTPVVLIVATWSYLWNITCWLNELGQGDAIIRYRVPCIRGWDLHKGMYEPTSEERRKELREMMTLYQPTNTRRRGLMAYKGKS